MHFTNSIFKNTLTTFLNSHKHYSYLKKSKTTNDTYIVSILQLNNKLGLETVHLMLLNAIMATDMFMSLPLLLMTVKI